MKGLRDGLVWLVSFFFFLWSGIIIYWSNFFLKGTGRSHIPKKGQILGELDDLLYHESVDICKMHEQGQYGDQGGQTLVMDEQMSWWLQRSEPE